MKYLSQFNLHMSQWCNLIPESIIALVLRLAIANVFWRSVQTKIHGWELFDQSLQFFNLGANTFTLFRYQYNVPILSYTQAAYSATFAEFFFAIMLFFGIGTRFAALGLLGVTSVIQLFVYPEAWPTHILWFAGLLYLVKHGAGNVSFDALLFNDSPST